MLACNSWHRYVVLSNGSYISAVFAGVVALVARPDATVSLVRSGQLQSCQLVEVTIFRDMKGFRIRASKHWKSCNGI